MESEAEWIGQRYISRFGTGVLEDLTEIGARLGASTGERQGHERVATAFKSVGLNDVHFQEFEMPHWERDAASLLLSAPRERSLDCISLPGSPPGTIEDEIVHLGYGLPEDFDSVDLDGKIAVARSDVPDHADRWMHRREKYFRAHENGASAFVFQNHVEGCLPPTGSVGGGTDVIGPIPAVGVSKEVGEQLARYHCEDVPTGTVTVETRISDGRSQNVTGTLGPDTDTEVIVSAHVDGHDISQGALDNASGVAVMCEVAAGLAAIEHQLETRVRFVGFGAEELGLVGSQRYAQNNDTSKIKAILNCDGAGRGRNMQVRTCGFEDIWSATEEISDEFNQPVERLPGVAAHSDHWPFVWRGIPGVQVRSDTGPGRGFGHTFADTFDKIDSRAIRTHGILVAGVARRLAEEEREVAHRNPADIRDELIAEKQDVSMRVAGEWPFES